MAFLKISCDNCWAECALSQLLIQLELPWAEAVSREHLLNMNEPTNKQISETGCGTCDISVISFITQQIQTQD